MLVEILNYYKRYFFETKREDIKLIENYIEYGNGKIKPEYLIDIDEAKMMNDRYNIINFILNLKLLDKTEENFKKVTKIWEIYERFINDKRIKKIRKDDEKILIKFFIDEKNKDLLLKIFNQDSIEYFLYEKIGKYKINTRKDENKDKINNKEQIENKELNEINKK